MAACVPHQVQAGILDGALHVLEDEDHRPDPGGGHEDLRRPLEQLAGELMITHVVAGAVPARDPGEDLQRLNGPVRHIATGFPASDRRQQAVGSAPANAASGSTNGWYGAPSADTHVPSNTAGCPSCSDITVFATNLDFPTRGSPPTNTT